MDFFDAAEEMHAAIEGFISENGSPPVQVNVSPFLYQWLARIQAEENFLQSREASADPGLIKTEFGEIRLVIDEALDDYEIIPE